MSVSNVWKVVQEWLDQQRFPPNQSKLAEALGVQRSAVSDWKSGKTRPNPAHLHALSKLMEPTLGPSAYTQLVLAIMGDMGFADWEATRRRWPEAAYFEYTGQHGYGVLHGLPDVDDEDDLSEVDDEIPAAAKEGMIEQPGEFNT